MTKKLNTAYPSFFGNFFTYCKFMEMTENDVVVHFKFGQSKSYSLSTFVGFPKLEVKYLHATIILGDVNNTKIRLLNRKQATLLLSKLEIKLQNILIMKVKQVQKLVKSLAFDEYLRDSSIDILAKELLPILNNYRNNHVIWHKYVHADSLTALKSLAKSTNTDSLTTLLRINFEQSRLKSRKLFYDTVEKNPLTTEQRLAVIRDNDRNLILAAAGTGKTSVMVAKAIDIIDRNKTSPDKILILAYNKDAANELKDRFKFSVEKLSSKENYKNSAPEIMTFHSLARMILVKSNLTTTLSSFAENPNEQKLWLEQWLCQEMKNNLEFIYQLLNTIYVIRKTDLDVSSAGNTQADKTQAFQNAQSYQTIAGYKVSNYQEYIVANYLCINGINHEYKKASALKDIFSNQISQGAFCLSSTKTYIECCSKNDLGQTIFDENRAQNSELITINEYSTSHDFLENKLGKNINDNKQVIDTNDLVEKIRTLGLMKKALDGYIKCLQAIRIEQLTQDEICDRFSTSVIYHSDEYTNILCKINKAYCEELTNQNAIDFDDMITNADNAITKKIFTPMWQHILVDEFQDISSTRYKLLNNLVHYGKRYGKSQIDKENSNSNKNVNAKKPKLTVVGDDWQSIYRFSGGNLELTTRFNELVGSHTLSKLQKTFRYNNSIANVAGRFVMENPEQYKKNVTTHNKVKSSQVFLHDDQVTSNSSEITSTNNNTVVNSVAQKAKQIITLLIKNNPQQSIAVIARFRNQLNQVKDVINSEVGSLQKLSKDKLSKENTKPIINFWTYHGSKGLEADNTILIGFENGPFGFPVINKTPQIENLLLPKLDDYPHTEERRLMYVGLTRARNQTHIIANTTNYSVFINELIENNYNINIVSSAFKKRKEKNNHR
jgi:DNA helicase-4